MLVPVTHEHWGVYLREALLGQAEDYMRPLLRPLLDMHALMYAELHHHKPAIQFIMLYACAS